ncbi:uncharacterized protein EDB91DRAFT_1334878 [Suillus paluster]|uniref:uncharacterized protein n=1 Tax=Suillus paluster TaxID=48578 RepID=UPI001B87FD8C|nr:uncharacterized protein EDB91DRAFT_1334878 [Suillus paluster]KAG1747128.1 hypothetical protein EDB91DRAFT_1334878 [Suillus paluster]
MMRLPRDSGQWERNRNTRNHWKCRRGTRITGTDKSNSTGTLLTESTPYHWAKMSSSNCPTRTSALPNAVTALSFLKLSLVTRAHLVAFTGSSDPAFSTSHNLFGEFLTRLMNLMNESFEPKKIDSTVEGCGQRRRNVANIHAAQICRRYDQDYSMTTRGLAHISCKSGQCHESSDNRAKIPISDDEGEENEGHPKYRPVTASTCAYFTYHKSRGSRARLGLADPSSRTLHITNYADISKNISVRERDLQAWQSSAAAASPPPTATHREIARDEAETCVPEVTDCKPLYQQAISITRRKGHLGSIGGIFYVQAYNKTTKLRRRQYIPYVKAEIRLTATLPADAKKEELSRRRRHARKRQDSSHWQPYWQILMLSKQQRQ